MIDYSKLSDRELTDLWKPKNISKIDKLKDYTEELVHRIKLLDATKNKEIVSLLKSKKKLEAEEIKLKEQILALVIINESYF